MKRYSSAYPGSMFESKDGRYALIEELEDAYQPDKPDQLTVRVPLRPFKVEVQTGGCDKCGNGTMYCIAKEDVEQLGEAWGGREEAEEWCEAMNLAYMMGLDDAYSKTMRVLGVPTVVKHEG
jgi:hypothetical protein